MESYKLNRNIEANVEEIVNARQLEQMLDTTTTQMAKWCQKACLKPKKDSRGNIYFSKSDIDVLKKVKELYEHTRQTEENRLKVESVVREMEHGENMIAQEELQNSQTPTISENNFLTRARLRFNKENAVATLPAVQGAVDLSTKLNNLENSIVSKISDVLSEKMDGLDEVIVELIRAKTENESLRQRLNELNKENFNLKNENASYKAVGLGLYVKKATDDFVL